MIKFSVVIPLYNKEKEIFNTLKSVLNQSYKADEVIVVDDGSSDNSAKIVEQEFSKSVTLIRQNNQGVSIARNSGILSSKNRYICFLDADDLWEVDFLKELAILIKSYPDAKFYSTAHKIMDENSNIINNKIPYKEDFRGVIDNFIKVFNNNYGLINSSSVCIDKSSNIFFPKNEKKGEDICFWIELSLKGKLAFSSRALSIYKLDTSNRSSIIHKEAVIPCQLKWIYNNTQRITPQIRNFVHKNILITCYNMGLEKDYSSIKEIIKYMKNHNDNFYFFIIPALIIPSNFINFIKKIRRKLR